MTKYETFDIFKNPLNCFVIMNSGVKAIDKFKSEFNYDKELITNFNKANFYHYYPPRDSKGRKRNEIDFENFPFGNITEESFEKTGKALVLDDIVSKGSTLYFIKKFLNINSYDDSEIFVFSQKIINPFLNSFVNLETYFLTEIRHYQDRINKASKSFVTN